LKDVKGDGKTLIIISEFVGWFRKWYLCILYKYLLYEWYIDDILLYLLWE